MWRKGRSGASGCRPEERPFAIGGAAGRLNVFADVGICIVMGGHFVEATAVLVESEPAPEAVLVVILTPGADDGHDAGDAVHHEGDQGPAAEADEGRVLILLSQVRSSSAERTRVFPFLMICLRPRTATAGLTTRSGPVTSRSKNILMAARCCLRVESQPV